MSLRHFHCGLACTTRLSGSKVNIISRRINVRCISITMSVRILRYKEEPEAVRLSTCRGPGKEN